MFFKSSLIIVLAFLCFISITSSKLSCLEIITKLSSFDKCLSSRHAFKVNLASKSRNANSFIKDQSNYNYFCNGTYFACGLTTSWVTEVFEGLKAQYNECKFYNGFNGEAAGYSTDYDNIFNTMGSLNFHIILHLRHTGLHDHVWTVEQLPYREGYRIYQSYQDVYSLKAWLSQNLTGLFEPENGDIMLPSKTKIMINAKIEEMTNGTASLENLEALPSIFEPLMPFLKYIRDINQTTVLEHFKKAWEKYGQSKIISHSEFWNEYLPKLRKIINFLKENETSSVPFPEEIYNHWIELYGATDNVVYPGLPTNVLTKLLDASKSYRFEALSRLLFAGMNSDDDDQCLKNANLIMAERRWNN